MSCCTTRRIALALLAAIALPRMADAQSTDERAVIAVVERMFDGMRTADSAKVRSVFAEGARFAGINARATPPAVRYDSVGGWIAAIAASDRRWDEQIYDVQAKVDAGIAIVWAPYTFYLDRKISHCGVNVVDLLRVAGEWRVIQIFDSRRREGCPDPLRTGSP